jgi:predicted  nucleic acid-binding Zn-ribbon protein
MSVAKDSLFELGACEEAIAELQQAKARLPEEIADREVKAQAARDAVEAAREQLADFEKKQRARETELQDCEAQRSKFQGQTALVKTNEEYTALLREIDGMSERVSALEEGILLGMEAIDEARGRLESVEKDQELIERGHIDDADRLRKELSRVEESLADRLGERGERLRLLGPEVERLFQKVARAHGTGVAIIRDDRCSGCHRAIPPQTVNLVMSGELRPCSNCQRILVPAEP